MTPIVGRVRIMSMFGLGVPELVVILVVVLLIFGPRKLPEAGRFLGRSLRDFRDALDRRDDEGSGPPAPPADRPPDAGSDEPPAR